jgi:membrane associated rhomboid family serine protease
MINDPVRREPALNMPGLVLASILALVGIHIGREWVAPTTDLKWLLEGGFVPARWSLGYGLATPDDIIREAASADGDADAASAQAALARYAAASGAASPFSALTYALLHGSWMHLVLNCVWLAAFGSPVVRRCGAGRAAVLAFVTTLGAAFTHWALNPLSPQIVIGASGAVSGFMGAAALFVFERPPSYGGWQPAVAPRRSSIAGLLRNRSALTFLGTWFGINLLLGLAAVPLGIAEGGIAWQAHLGGLLAGLLVFPYLDPVGRGAGPREA